MPRGAKETGKRVKTAKGRTASSVRWLERQLNDPYVKQAKAEGVLRRGAAFVAIREDDAILLRTRPPKGLLGGMAEPPTSRWTADYDWERATDDARA